MTPKKESIQPDPTSPHKRRTVTPTPRPADAAPTSNVHSESVFPIVGLGASAGGLAAIEAFFTAVPPQTKNGMAFVVVQHLDPDHKSILIDLVRQYTSMQVFMVEDGLEVQPDCVYVIPPNRDMTFLHGTLHLIEPGAPRGLRLPIDLFFRSLAQDQHERAICIVLSGTGTDGTLGLKAIKGEGGMAMVQSPESAAYDGMPRSALATGLADYTLPPDKMPGQLIAYVKHAFGRKPQPVAVPTPHSGNVLQKVFFLLHSHTGHDFSLYKQNTINRRIERRMAVTQIDHIEDYILYLQKTPLEIETLFRELLIGVTNFFRDPQAFELLKEHVIPKLFQSSDATVRIWVPGCSTGEEAYSLAILLREHADELKSSFQIQVFATDIDAEAIEKARTGLYPDNIAADVSVEHLLRHFTRDDNSYRIRKNIRDMMVFSKQDVLKDPPFSKIDLISCRNLLIYLGAELQKKLILLFHYALNRDKFLFLGDSETIGEFGNLFSMVDKKIKLFQRRNVATPHAAITLLTSPQAMGRIVPLSAPVTRMDVRNLIEKALLESYAPACVLINAAFEVLYIHGHTGKYLEPAAGEANLNLLHMVREGLRLELTAAVRKAIAQQTMIRCVGLRIKSNGNTLIINLVAQPMTKPDSMRGLIMIVFEDVYTEIPPETVIALEPHTAKEQHIVDLEQELGAKQEYLQTMIEEFETVNEELMSTNEELQSANEELQSTNEELQTSREELQSLNEELMTVNNELIKSNDELSRTNNDMNNLLAGTGIATIFIDNQLQIQRFTPEARQIINLIQTDVGRPVSDIVSRLVGYDHLMQDAQVVLDSLVTKEAEVRTREGRWYLMRIQPYRTLDNVIEGLVLTFVEVTKQKELQGQIEKLAQTAQEARQLAESVVDTVREPLLVLNGRLEVVSTNESFYEFFQVTPVETIGRLFYDLGGGQWKIPQLRELLEEILPQKKALKGFQVTHDFITIGRRMLLLNAREVLQMSGKERLILLAMQDVT
jgi:two-component system, chemotaxis family, CheB/CheR fusion protein